MSISHNWHILTGTRRNVSLSLAGDILGRPYIILKMFLSIEFDHESNSGMNLPLPKNEKLLKGQHSFGNNLWCKSFILNEILLHGLNHTEQEMDDLFSW